MATLELDAVTKVFDDGGESIVAVDDVSLTVADGEFLVLVGPSGCGKSTTLRMIAGLETVTSGAIRLGGERVDQVPPRERNLAMVFQSYALYPHMSVRENMRFGLEESTDLPKAEMNERVEETATMLGIPNLLDRKPGELSGGQQQRVALGRAIVRDPAAFLMDEPLSNLDAKLRAQMRTELQELQAKLGTTTVYVTHDQTEAMTMGDRIAILDEGRLMQVGTPLECYHRPNNQFVAGFIGEPSMNFLPATTTADGLRLDGGLAYPLAGDAAEAVRGVENVTFGIRPEDVIVEAGERRGDSLDGGDSADGGGSADNRESVDDGGSAGGGSVDGDDPAGGNHAFRGRIDVVEPTGNENVLHLTVDGASVTATVGGLRRVEQGSEVVVRFPPEAIHLFDADSGVALHNRVLEDGQADPPNVAD